MSRVRSKPGHNSTPRVIAVPSIDGIRILVLSYIIDFQRMATILQVLIQLRITTHAVASMLAASQTASLPTSQPAKRPASWPPNRPSTMCLYVRTRLLRPPLHVVLPLPCPCPLSTEVVAASSCHCLHSYIQVNTHIYIYIYIYIRCPQSSLRIVQRGNIHEHHEIQHCVTFICSS